MIKTDFDRDMAIAISAFILGGNGDLFSCFGFGTCRSQHKDIMTLN